jgi:hypothetical protein
LAKGTYVLGNFEKIFYEHLDKRLFISYICRQVDGRYVDCRLSGKEEIKRKAKTGGKPVLAFSVKVGRLRVRTVMLLKNKGVTGASQGNDEGGSMKDDRGGVSRTDFSPFGGGRTD